VNEIIGIANLPTDISNEVIFCSPKFTVKNSYEKTGGNSGGRNTSNDDPTIDDEKEADSDRKITKLNLQKSLCPLPVLMEQKRQHLNVQVKRYTESE
jgi:hypothetical protein